jgi:hypothetical protein
MTERKRSPRKNIMREFSISELSAVDRPAQQHARMTLMKRAAPDNPLLPLLDRPDNPPAKQEQEPMQKILSRNDDPPRSFGSLEDAMKFIASQNPDMAQSDIMGQAARQHPTLLRKYQSEGEEAIAKAVDERLTIMTVPPAVREFHALIDRIKTRDGCDSVTALRRARSENPALFEQYQSA